MTNKILTDEEAYGVVLEYWRKKCKEYRAEHPEKKLQYRINAAIKLLTKNDYTVLKNDLEHNGAEPSDKEVIQ